jgi:putative NADPH-quinone reductase
MVYTEENTNNETENNQFSFIPGGLREKFSDQEIKTVIELTNKYSLHDLSTLLITTTNQKIDKYQEVEEKDPAEQHQLMMDRVLANKLLQASKGRI